MTPPTKVLPSCGFRPTWRPRISRRPKARSTLSPSVSTVSEVCWEFHLAKCAWHNRMSRCPKFQTAGHQSATDWAHVVRGHPNGLDLDHLASRGHEGAHTLTALSLGSLGNGIHLQHVADGDSLCPVGSDSDSDFLPADEEMPSRPPSPQQGGILADTSAASFSIPPEHCLDLRGSLADLASAAHCAATLIFVSMIAQPLVLCIASWRDILLPDAEARVSGWLAHASADMNRIDEQLSRGTSPDEVVRDRPAPLNLRYSPGLIRFAHHRAGRSPLWRASDYQMERK